MVDVKTPAYTSTPIIQRQNGIMDQNITSDTVSMKMNRIEHLNNGIKAIQRDVTRHMENKLNELESSLISSIENLNHKSTYANAVTRPGLTQMTEQPSVEVCQNILDSCYIDEG